MKNALNEILKSKDFNRIKIFLKHHETINYPLDNLTIELFDTYFKSSKTFQEKCDIMDNHYLEEHSEISYIPYTEIAYIKVE